MDLTLDEHKLVAEFRRLSPAGKRELLDFVSLLQKRQESAAPAEEEAAPQDRCTLERKEERPEAAKEPIFTE